MLDIIPLDKHRFAQLQCGDKMQDAKPTIKAAIR